MAYIVAYIAAAAVFFGCDFVWLSAMTERVYRPEIGPLLFDRPNLTIAALFYLVYLIGVVALAVVPGLTRDSWLVALGCGLLLGLVAYGTYDLTNLSTLKGWSVTMTAIDMAWGTALTGAAATAGYFGARWAGA